MGPLIAPVTPVASPSSGGGARSSRVLRLAGGGLVDASSNHSTPKNRSFVQDAGSSGLSLDIIGGGLPLLVEKSQDHPDLEALQQEIDSLKKHVSSLVNHNWSLHNNIV